jgi:hypothetical protein
MTKSKQQIYRQGDVAIIPVSKVPTQLTPVKRDKGAVVLAYGEVTGHAHRIPSRSAKLFRDETDARYLRIGGGGGAELKHEEHGTIKLPPGNYKVIRQREHTPAAIVQVAD